MRRRRIIGIQTHHSVQLDDALRGAANLCAGLSGALTCTGDPEHARLLDEARALAKRIAQARGVARQSLSDLYERDPELFRRCREGELPWPDETLGGFEPRCSCADRCLIHDLGVDAPAEHCRCGRACPAHPDLAA